LMRPVIEVILTSFMKVSLYIARNLDEQIGKIPSLSGAIHLVKANK